jgi:hypothetical protein
MTTIWSVIFSHVPPLKCKQERKTCVCQLGLVSRSCAFVSQSGTEPVLNLCQGTAHPSSLLQLLALLLRVMTRIRGEVQVDTFEQHHFVIGQSLGGRIPHVPRHVTLKSDGAVKVCVAGEKVTPVVQIDAE